MRLAGLLGGSTDVGVLLAVGVVPSRIVDDVVVTAAVSATSASSSVVQEDEPASASSSVVQEDESESVVSGEGDLLTGRQTWWLTPSIVARVLFLPREDSFSSIGDLGGYHLGLELLCDNCGERRRRVTRPAASISPFFSRVPPGRLHLPMCISIYSHGC